MEGINWVAIIKIFSMIVMFITIIVTGLIPIYLYNKYLEILLKKTRK